MGDMTGAYRRPTDRTVVLHRHDNVEVVVEGESENRGHKFAIAAIEKGAEVIKLGQTIGVASTWIEPGDHVHTHNTSPSRVPASADNAASRLVTPSPVEDRSFAGFVRPNGSVGTRNHILVLTSVNCSASVARVAARQARDAGLGAGVDGISALTHHGGCGLGADTEGLANLRRTLAGYARHPNVGGAVIIGLGCEVNQISEVVASQGLSLGDRIRTIGIQEAGGSEATVAGAVDTICELVELARTDERSNVGVEHLALALQCGGSDGYSAITANPALGVASDLLVSHGGTVVLGETPEMHGAEHLLVERAVDGCIAEALLARLAWWRDHNEPEHNPSPGNKRGGLTTIAEKSLGAIAKAGSSPLTDVLRYAEPLRSKGFVIMDSPGYDPCAVTGEIASGCNLVCFTTGRGSVSGFAPAPCIKVSTNSALFERMAGDIDLDAGTIVSGDATVQEVGEQLFDLMVDVASGRETASERLGFGEEEFVPWQMGVIT